MVVEKFNKLDTLISSQEQVKLKKFHNYFLSSKWGVSATDPDKALIVNIFKPDQLYEKFFRGTHTDTTSQIELLLNWLQENNVVIPEPAQVREYLTRYFDLLRILRSTCKLALDHMGTVARLALEVYRDPEIDDAYLSLNIRQQHYTKNMLKQIKDLRAECAVDLANSSGMFFVTTDFCNKLISLKNAADSKNLREFARLANMIKWSEYPVAELARTIDLALALDMVQLARELIRKGRKSFPHNKRIKQAERVLSPPLLVRTRPAQATDFELSQQWLKEHSSRYKGLWVAVAGGTLLGSASTLKQLYEKIESIERTLETIIVKVLS
jgi:hypothetical protein